MNGKMWVISCDLDTETLTWKHSDYKTKSIMLLRYYVETLREFAPDRVSIWNSGGKNLMLIMKDWKVIHEIADPDAGNVSKSF